MRRTILLLGCVISLLAGACQSMAPRTPAPSALEAQARAFMARYADDLRAGDRAALGQRYHPDGAWFLGNGRKAFGTHAQIVERYAVKWRKPARFEWQELTYEPVGDAGVLVLGKFLWQSEGEDARITSYSGLLLPVDGDLRIRVEDESRGVPQAP